MHINSQSQTPLQCAQMVTPLGIMCLIIDESSLYVLAFEDSKHIAKHMARLQQTRRRMVGGSTEVTKQITDALEAYFANPASEVVLTRSLVGTRFQRQVWEAIQQIPVGKTASYAAIAQAIGNPLATRAVAAACSSNPCAILVPCHRVILSHGALGGYNGGMWRKKWLLAQESLVLA